MLFVAFSVHLVFPVQSCDLQRLRGHIHWSG